MHTICWVFLYSDGFLSQDAKNFISPLSIWKRRGIPVVLAKRCALTFSIAVSSAPVFFSTLSVLAALNWCKAPAHCRCVSGLSLNFAAAVGISSGSTHTCSIAGSPVCFRIHSGSPVLIFTRVCLSSVFFMTAQTKKRGRNCRKTERTQMLFCLFLCQTAFVKIS